MGFVTTGNSVMEPKSVHLPAAKLELHQIVAVEVAMRSTMYVLRILATLTPVRMEGSAVAQDLVTPALVSPVSPVAIASLTSMSAQITHAMPMQFAPTLLEVMSALAIKATPETVKFVPISTSAPLIPTIVLP